MLTPMSLVPLRTLGLVLTVASLTFGCITRSVNPGYPKDWPPPAPDRVGTCPDLSGTYRNTGELYIESGIVCDRQHIAPGAEAGFWDCRLELAPNLGIDKSADAVELRHPDPASLELTLLDVHGKRVESRTLKLEKDYQCETDGLNFSFTRSLLGNPTSTVIGAVMLIGGVLNHSRTFLRDSEGNLLMIAREQSVAWGIVIGGTGSATSYVRWMAVTPAKPIPSDKP